MVEGDVGVLAGARLDQDNRVVADARPPRG